MAEHPFAKPTALETGAANWAFDPSDGSDSVGSVPSVPDGPRRLSGFSNTLPDAPDASEFNYAFREALKAATWLAGAAEREFDDLFEAIEALEPGDVFRLRRDAQDGRTTPILSSAVTGAAVIEAIATDGRHVYVGTGTGDVVAVRWSSPGTAVWVASAVTGGSIESIYACGDFIAVYTDTGSLYEVAFLDPDDGSHKYVRISRTPPTSDEVICANGEVVAFNHGAAGRLAEIYVPSTVTSLTAAIQWGGGTAGQIRALAISDDRLYAVGSQNDGNNHVQCFLLTGSTTAQWSAPIIATSGTPDARGVCTDGERVFVCGDRINSSGTNYSVWCYSKYGDLLWRSDLGGDTEAVACDDQYLYVAGASNALGVFCKITGAIIEILPTVFHRSIDAIATDGVHVYTGNSGNLVRTTTGRKSSRWVVADGANIHRRPFFQLATPE